MNVCLCMRKQAIRPIAAAHDDLRVSNVIFAIQKRTLTASGLNG